MAEEEIPSDRLTKAIGMFSLEIHREELLHGEPTDWHSSLGDCLEYIEKLQNVITSLKVRVVALEAVLDAAKRYKELPMSDDDNRRLWLAIQNAERP